MPNTGVYQPLPFPSLEDLNSDNDTSYSGDSELLRFPFVPLKVAVNQQVTVRVEEQSSVSSSGSHAPKHDYSRFSSTLRPKSPRAKATINRRPSLASWMTDDTASMLSFSTATSSSTTLGIGMISGRLVKALGERSLAVIENVVIRRRLAAIKNTINIDSKSALCWTEPSQERQAIVDDLRELLR